VEDEDEATMNFNSWEDEAELTNNFNYRDKEPQEYIVGSLPASLNQEVYRSSRDTLISPQVIPI
jgi:hypothetical protein